MKTALISQTTPATSIASAPAPGRPERAAGPGRPTALNERMMDMLCSIIRETGASDGAAAAQAGIHPSTVWRWKRDCPDLAILLRAAREEFRAVHLGIVLETAQAGGATGLRAAMWLLERVFPEDYAPRAKERALFQERFEAVCASESEGSEIALPDRGEPLQNVQNPPCDVSHEPPASFCKDSGDALVGKSAPGRPLQNVKNAPLAGPICPRPATSRQAGEEMRR